MHGSFVCPLLGNVQLDKDIKLCIDGQRGHILLTKSCFPPTYSCKIVLNICVYQVKTYCANFTEVNTFYYV